MSKRTLRRAAERQARKLDRTNTVAQAAMQSSDDIATALPAVPPLETPDLAALLSATLALPAPPAGIEPPHSATQAQMNANRANAQFSTCPTTPEGKATVSQNRRFHGLAGRFALLMDEDSLEFQKLGRSIFDEYQPETDTEERLAHSAIQHYWLMQRALNFQQNIIIQTDGDESGEKRLGLFLRYQTTHERSYYKALRELQNLKKQKVKQQIGFESQNAKNESLEAKTRLNNARAATLEIDAAVKKVMEAPIPGTTNISFEELAQACSRAISNVVFQKQFEKAG